MGGALGEVEIGWVTAMVTLSGEIARNAPSTQGYAIEEIHGNRAAELRLIGDFRASDIDALVQTGDTNVPGNLDVCFAAPSYFPRVSPGCSEVRSNGF